MSERLLSRIQRMAPGLSKGQRMIAKYITENYDKAAYMTAAKLGQAVGVSESTVVRFATEIGFDGYPQLQRAVQELVRNRLTSVQRIDVFADRISEDDILASVMNLDIDMIRRTIDESSREEFNAAVDLLCSARRIYIIGTRSASALASFMGYYMSLVFEYVTVIDPSNESDIFEQMLRIGREDVVLGISFPRYSNRVVTAMRFASDNGASIIALTDSHSSPLAPYATRLLLARSDMASIVDSLVAPMSVVNALVAATALRRRDELSVMLRKLESIWDDYDVYEKSGTEE